MFEYINVNYCDISVLILGKDMFSLYVLAPSIVRFSEVLQSWDYFVLFHDHCCRSVDAAAGKKKQEKKKLSIKLALVKLAVLRPTLPTVRI